MHGSLREGKLEKFCRWTREGGSERGGTSWGREDGRRECSDSWNWGTFEVHWRNLMQWKLPRICQGNLREAPNNGEYGIWSGHVL